MADLERGFRNQCDKMSVELRAELGLKPWDRLDMDRLAEHLDIEVLPIALTGASADVLAWACSLEGSACFSALTLPAPSGARVIVLNDSHELPRRASNLAHELAHALLLHEPAPVNAADGSRTYESLIEREAEYLAGALLIPGPMARGIVKRVTPLAAAAAVIGVSEEMMTYRLQVTGALRSLRR